MQTQTLNNNEIFKKLNWLKFIEKKNPFKFTKSFYYHYKFFTFYNDFNCFSNPTFGLIQFLAFLTIL